MNAASKTATRLLNYEISFSALFTGAYLLYLTGEARIWYWPVVYGQGLTPDSYDFFRAATILVVLVVTGLFSKVLVAYFRRLVFLYCLIAFMAASLAYAPGGSYTQLALSLILMLSTLAYWLSGDLDKRMLATLSWFSLIILASIAYAVVFPDYGIMKGYHAGRWRGLFVHKNQFGDFLTFTLPFIFASYSLKRISRATATWLSGVVYGLILLSGSTSALLLATGVLIFHLAIFLLARAAPSLRSTSLAIYAFLGAVLALLGSAAWSAFLALLNKDPTLTGREQIWRSVARYLEDNPGFIAFGEGFGAATTHQAFLDFLRKGSRWYELLTTHNAYLDVLVSLGVFGLLLYLVVLSQTFARALLLLSYSSSIVSFSRITLAIELLLLSIARGMATSEAGLTASLPLAMQLVAIAIVSRETSSMSGHTR